MPKPSISTLQRIAESAHIPGVSYSYVEPKEGSEQEFISTSLAIGKKDATNSVMRDVDIDTQFPASSLSKIVFTYLVLQLVEEKHIDLDVPLHDILQYERFLNKGEYRDKAKQLTARDVLSHTTGLPNFGAGSDLSSPLSFADDADLGKGYSYSGEAILYLQKVIVTRMSQILGENIDLEALAQKYVFKPLKMEHSTFLPKPDSTNIVMVHSELGKPTSIDESIPNLRYNLELLSSLPHLNQAENGKIYLSENPREYYVKGMSEPASIPPEINLTNLATKLDNLSFKSDILAMTSKMGNTPHLNAAGTLLTTAADFSKFIAAWLKNINAPIFQQAFEFETSLALSDLTPEEFHRLSNDENTQKFLKNATERNYQRIPFNQTEIDDLKRAISTQKEIEDLSAKIVVEPTRTYNITKTCGLGWHLYKDADKVIAYQYGENLNTRSFIAINVTDKKGAAFFTNSEQGMSIATQILSSPDLAQIGDLQELFRHMPHYTQSDEPGWKETIEGKLAEEQGDIERAISCFRAAIVASPNDKSKQLRLEWFDLVHQYAHEEKEFTPSLKTFEGIYTNPFGEKREIYNKDGALICKEFDNEIKLVRISNTDFLPEKNQEFKISLQGDKATIHFIHSAPKFIFEQSSLEASEHAAFFAALSEQVQDADEVDGLMQEETDVAGDLTQRYRKSLDNIKQEPLAAKDAVDKNSSPSSSQAS